MEERRLCEFVNEIQMSTIGKGSKNPTILWTSYLEAPLPPRVVPRLLPSWLRRCSERSLREVSQTIGKLLLFCTEPRPSLEPQLKRLKIIQLHACGGLVNCNVFYTTFLCVINTTLMLVPKLPV